MDADSEKGVARARRIPSVERLVSLPAIFTIEDLGRLQNMADEAARVWVKRMAKAGLIQFAGPRSGCYYNVLRYPNSPQDNLLDVVARLHPDAVVIGAAVLHAYQWVTQIPQIVDIAVTPRRSVAAIDGVRIHPRPRSWYRERQDEDAILRDGESFFAIDSLTPAAALADVKAYAASGIWSPDPDDLYVPDDMEEGVTRHGAPQHA